MLYVIAGIFVALFGYIQVSDDIHMPTLNDPKAQEIKYVHNVKKQEEKEKYERAKFNRNPSGYMTLEEYEALSAPKDKMAEKVEIPKVEKPSDMKYVPQPSYRIVRYNNPPGSAEIALDKEFYKNRQKNAQGIVAPDYSKMVYSSIYYYPNNGSTASDLFVIPLDDAVSNINKIKTAHVMHRNPEPILSTDKTIDNYATFRTLTPVDFSADCTKLLAKEKIGNSHDGIWQTNAWVYDFTNKTSYNLVEVRDAIIYYWKENANLDLEDKRWDIYPLGFDLNNPDRVVVNAYAYTGEKPVNLGTWSIDYRGQQSRLITFNQSDVKISMNGLKIVQDGVVPKSVSEIEEKQMKRNEKALEKEKKLQEKKELDALEQSYKARIKEMNAEYKQTQKDYKLRQKIQATTSANEFEAKYQEEKAKIQAKEQQALEKKKQRELKKVEKQRLREERKKQKELEKNNNSNSAL